MMHQSTALLMTKSCITRASWHHAMAWHPLKFHVMEYETRISNFQGAMQLSKKPAQAGGAGARSFGGLSGLSLSLSAVEVKVK